MIYLIAKEVTFEVVGQSDNRLLIGHFSRTELEDLLQNAQNDVFSVYFYQNEVETADRKVRLGISENDDPPTGDDPLFCPPYCYP